MTPAPKLSKKDQICYYFERNESLPPDQRISNNEIAEKIGCAPAYVSDIKKVWMKSRVLAKKDDFQTIAKTEGDRTLLVLRETTDDMISLRGKLKDRIDKAVASGAAGEIRNLVDTLTNLTRELRQSLYFVHELRGDLGSSKQGNIVIFYNNLIDELVKVLLQFVAKLPPDLKIEFLEILDKFTREGRNYQDSGSKPQEEKMVIDAEYVDLTKTEGSKENAVPDKVQENPEN